MIAAIEHQGFSAARLVQLAHTKFDLSHEAALELGRGAAGGHAYDHTEDWRSLWRAALELLEGETVRGGPDLLSLVLREADCASLGALGFYMATSPTLRAACDAFVRGFPLLSTKGSWTCLTCDDAVTVSFDGYAEARSNGALNEVLSAVANRGPFESTVGA